MLAEAGLEGILCQKLNHGTFILRKEALICLKNYCHGEIALPRGQFSQILFWIHCPAKMNIEAINPIGMKEPSRDRMVIV